MPDVGYLSATQSPVAASHGSTVRRLVLVGAVIAGGALAGVATPAAEAARAAQAAGPELTRLLRAMAGLKLMFAVAGLLAVYWRLALPASTWRLGCYAAAAAALAAGPVLVWQMAHVALGATLLHGGLLAAALLLWRDPAVARFDRIFATFPRLAERQQQRVQTLSGGEQRLTGLAGDRSPAQSPDGAGPQPVPGPGPAATQRRASMEFGARWRGL